MTAIATTGPLTRRIQARRSGAGVPGIPATSTVGDSGSRSRLPSFVPEWRRRVLEGQTDLSRDYTDQ